MKSFVQLEKHTYIMEKTFNEILNATPSEGQGN
jgi:hypothetical protein